MSAEKHEFAVYKAGLMQDVGIRKDDFEWWIDDADMCHRIAKILRMKIGDTVTFFDRFMHAQCQLQEIKSKRLIVMHVVMCAKNVILAPAVTCVLPLLKRDDLEQAVYLLAELGVSDIQLVITNKSVHAWNKEKDLERLERIMVAAAEQSKQFAMPVLRAPITFELWCEMAAKQNAIKIYFDMHGEPLLHYLAQHEKHATASYTLMMGPEGDLTAREKEAIQHVGFSFCKLTPTTLRAVHALCVGVGAFRSL